MGCWGGLGSSGRSTNPTQPKSINSITNELRRWKKVVGIEYLAGLHKEAQRYLGKYRGGSPVTLVNKDFVDVSLEDADVVFLYATKYSPAEVQQVLSTVPVGARVISLDRTLNQRNYKVRACVGVHASMCVRACVRYNSNRNSGEGASGLA